MASPGRRQGSGTKQEVARACWRASGTRPPAYWQEVEDGGTCGGLGQLELGQVGCQVSARYFLTLSFNSVFLFIFLCFDLV